MLLASHFDLHGPVYSVRDWPDLFVEEIHGVVFHRAARLGFRAA